jgi:hypothetical protein
VIVELTGDAVRVVDADDCTRLHVATSLPRAAADSTLRAAGIGHLTDDGGGLLAVDALRAMARSVATTPNWDVQWQKMIAYAGRAGWLDDAGRTVRVHVEANS